MRAVLRRVSSNATIIEFLDPFGRVRESVATGDGECGEATIFDVPIWGLGEHFDIPDEAGLHELDGFVAVIHLLFEFCLLGDQILLEVVGAGFRGDDQSVDDGSVGVGWEVVAGDGTVD